jgi:2,3-bisphosphoglycerate-independent phosphoglycerate mutase
MQPTDIAFRCNLVTLSPDLNYQDKTMEDYSSDEISTEESAVLIQEINQHLSSDKLKFYPGISYRHLLLWQEGLFEFDLTPPHDISGRKITDYLPKGDQSQVLLDLMMRSYNLLVNHPINLARISQGKRPANSIWFWGQGKKPVLPSFPERYNLNGSVVCAVDLIKGLGISAGLEAVAVPGATGGTMTDYRAKARAALEQLQQGKDFVFLHVEAPDEASHRGELDTKIKAIEEIDEKVVGPILQGLERSQNLPGMEDYCLLILPDHPTPISTRTHSAEEVPFLIYRHSQPQENPANSYDEDSARLSGLRLEAGHELMEYFIELGRR